MGPRVFEPRPSYSIDSEGNARYIEPKAAVQESSKDKKQAEGSPIWPPKPAGKLGNIFYVPRADCCEPDNNVIFASWEVVLRHRWNGAVEGFDNLNAAGNHALTHRRVGEYRLVFT